MAVPGQTAKKDVHPLLYLEFVYDSILLALYTIKIIFMKIFSFLIPATSKSLKNEVILVTGGANGIGREICRHLVKKELCLTIISWDVDEKNNNILVKELQALGVRKAFGFKVDVSDRDQVKSGAIAIRQQIGDVTMLFNNAGIAGETGIGWKLSAKNIEKVFQVNLISHCWMLQEFLPSMLSKKKGHVVETCSILGFAWGKHGSPYIASKHGLKAYIESIKEDIRSLPEKTNIVFTLVYPHNTLTQMTSKANLVARKYPFLLPKLTPKEVGSSIVEGVLRNDEHIFIPAYCRLIVMILALLPPEVIRRLTDLPCIEEGPNSNIHECNQSDDGDSDSGSSFDSSPSLD